MVLAVLAFDFDDTLITNVPEETYLAVCRRLRGEGEAMPNPNNHPRNIVDFQNEVFKFLFDKGLDIEGIKRIADFKYVSEGMNDLLDARIDDLDLRIAVITDNNDFVVNYSLEKLGLRSKIDKVIGNRGRVDEKGMLVATPWKMQDHCALSFENLCKGEVLFDYVAEVEKEAGRKVDFIGYGGDNKNDICPALALREGDLAFPRKGHPLVGFLEERKAEMKATVHPWESGKQIVEVIKEKVQSLKKADGE